MSELLYKSIFDIENNSGEYEELDMKIINFIKMANDKSSYKKPDPTYFTISTQSAMCYIQNIYGLDLSKLIAYISRNIIQNVILDKREDYMIKGIVIDNLIIRYDDTYIKKYKKPYIKYMGQNIDIESRKDIENIMENLSIVENESLKKQGKTTKKKENEHFYNSCSIIIKSAVNEKCVNVKLFNNGKITMTGAKKEMDGYNACCILLDEIKKDTSLFLEFEKIDFSNIKIAGYQITMINSDFNTNFKIDLLSLLNILNSNDTSLFTKFNPEKYRGLIIGFYWNTHKEKQDGKCMCKNKCKGKGNGNGDGNCKKITISTFKSGSIIITGGRLVKQVEDAYAFINELLTDHYSEIIKLSILDFIENEEDTGSVGSTTEEPVTEPAPKKTVKKMIKIKKVKK